MIVKAVAPNRILDFGGWTDTWFARTGCVLNFAVDLYAKVVDSPASDQDLAWAREMLNTWRPDLRKDNRVVRIVSEVWRRNSSIPQTNYMTVSPAANR